MRLLDRGYDSFDQSIFANRPQMMGNLLGHMVRDPELREEFIEQMLQHRQFMQELLENKQFQQRLNNAWRGFL